MPGLFFAVSRFNVRNNGWTEPALDWLRENWPHMIKSKLSEVLGCSPSAVIGKAHRMNLPSKASPIIRDPIHNRRPPLSDETRAWAASQGLPTEPGSKFFQHVKLEKAPKPKLPPTHGSHFIERKKPPKPPKPPVPSVVRPAPIQLPPPQLPALALERGAPGVWRPPIGLPWHVIQQIAEQSHYELFGGLEALPGFNRSRVARGFAPLAIARGKANTLTR